MHFQCCMVFVLGGLSHLLKHLKGAVAPLAPLVPPPMIEDDKLDFDSMHMSQFCIDKFFVDPQK